MARWLAQRTGQFSELTGSAEDRQHSSARDPRDQHHCARSPTENARRRKLLVATGSDFLALSGWQSCQVTRHEDSWSQAAIRFGRYFGVVDNAPREPANNFYVEWMTVEHARGLSAHAWVARYRHTLHFGSVLAAKYDDPVLDAWVRDVEALLDDWDIDIARLRRQHLSVWQRLLVRREERAERDPF